MERRHPLYPVVTCETALLSLAKLSRRNAGRVLDFAWVADAFLRTRPRITGILAESGSGCDLVRRNASSLTRERPASRFSPIRTRRRSQQWTGD
jgi:hypothetical protein